MNKWLITIGVASALALLLLLGALKEQAVLPKPACDEAYGNYLAVSVDGSLATSYCKKGKRGLLLRTNSHQEWLEPAEGLYSTPSFSPDGRLLSFAWLDMEQGKSGLYIYDVASKDKKRIITTDGAISFSAISFDNRQVFYWQGDFRKSGKTVAAGFRLYRHSLVDGAAKQLDGPFYMAYPISADESGGVYYSLVGELNQNAFGVIARTVKNDAPQPLEHKLNNLGGSLVYTKSGFFWLSSVLDRKTGKYRYCLEGPDLSWALCGAGLGKFSVSFDGRFLAIFDESGQPAVRDLATVTPPGNGN
jgi:hypothetical protein